MTRKVDIQLARDTEEQLKTGFILEEEEEEENRFGCTPERTANLSPVLGNWIRRGGGESRNGEATLSREGMKKDI